MHSLTTILIVLSSLLLSTHNRYEEEKNSGSFSATVDGKPFVLREDQLFRGLLLNKSASMDGRTPARTVINTSLNGTSYNLADGRVFNDLVQFEIGYEGEKLGEPTFYAVALQFNSTNYFMFHEDSKLNITHFVWETDKKHFIMTAEFSCKMRSFGYPGDGKKDVSFKGKMTDIRITVPSWIAQKN